MPSHHREKHQEFSFAMGAFSTPMNQSIIIIIIIIITLKNPKMQLSSPF